MPFDDRTRDIHSARKRPADVIAHDSDTLTAWQCLNADGTSFEWRFWATIKGTSPPQLGFFIFLHPQSCLPPSPSTHLIYIHPLFQHDSLLQTPTAVASIDSTTSLCGHYMASGSQRRRPCPT
ncbi:hypothetical protein TOPH_04364 [Tolypocladium ophioglossoides CBS 100239]|uniref:Uncharacterized protein n=1 Tax=Tolypocladium ophioglossoides (strain CBS 100239) TaxID=1163406 RepID=A0A0L0NB11_TOLOC|nr:hypothetical protein TOPH_04364 [Tolypocladium ophioglossoides CBS 100239]